MRERERGRKEDEEYNDRDICSTNSLFNITAEHIIAWGGLNQNLTALQKAYRNVLLTATRKRERKRKLQINMELSIRLIGIFFCCCVCMKI